MNPQYRNRYTILKKPRPGVQYMSPKEVASKLRKPLATIYTWCKEGAIKGVYHDSKGHWGIPSNFEAPIYANHHLSKKRRL